MSNYPATPSFGGPFQFHPQHGHIPPPPPLHGNHYSVPPPQYQQPYSPHPPYQGPPSTYAAGRSLNSFAFSANHQNITPQAQSNGVPPLAFPAYGQIPNSSLPPPPFPPIPIPQYGPPTQAFSAANEASTTIFKPNVSLPPRPIPLPAVTSGFESYINGSTNGISNISETKDREDGELSDGEAKLSQARKQDQRLRPSQARDEVNARKTEKNGVQALQPMISNGAKENTPGPSRQSPRISNQSLPRESHVPGINCSLTSNNPKTSSDSSRLNQVNGLPTQHSRDPHPYLQQIISPNPTTTFNTSKPNNLPYLNNVENDKMMKVHPTQQNGDVTQRPPSQIRDQVKLTLLRLHDNNIGFTELIQEGVNETLLRGLYAEIRVPVPAPNSSRVNNLSEPVESVQLSEETQKSRELMKHTTTSPNLSNPHLASESPPTEVTGMPKITKDVLKNPFTEAENRSGHSKITGSNENPSIPTPTPVVPLPRPGANAASNKPILGKAADKTLERKDYIARMLAAKAGKLMPTSTVSQSSPLTLAPSTASQGTRPVISNESLKPPPLMAGSPSALAKDKQNIDNVKADLESKKQAQTELARQRIEALAARESAIQHKQDETAIEAATGSHEPVPAPSASPPMFSPSPPSVAIDANQKIEPLIPAKQQIRIEQQPRPVINAHQQNDDSRTLQFTYQGSTTTPFTPPPFSGIPGLFMFSAPQEPTPIVENPSPAIMESSGLELRASRSSLSPKLHEVQSVHPSSPSLSPSPKALSQQSISPNLARTTLSTSGAVNSSRKRAKASDFIDSPAIRFKRTFGQTTPSQLIIEVSDDELNEADDSNDDGLLSDTMQSIPDHAKSVPSNSSKYNTVRDLPPLPDFPVRRTFDTPPAVQSPGQEVLKRKEEQIEVIKRRIAEMEQRRIAKENASRAATPGRGESETNSGAPRTDAVQQSVVITDAVRSLDANTKELETQKSMLIVAENTMQEKLAAEQEARQTIIEKAEIERLASEDAKNVAEEEKRRKRRNVIESRLPLLDAEVQRTKEKIENMRREMEGLATELEKGVVVRQSLLQELEWLATANEENAPMQSPDNTTANPEHFADVDPIPRKESEPSREVQLVPPRELETSVSSRNQSRAGTEASCRQVLSPAIQAAADNIPRIVTQSLDDSTDEGEITDYSSGPSRQSGLMQGVDYTGDRSMSEGKVVEPSTEPMQLSESPRIPDEQMTGAELHPPQLSDAQDRSTEALAILSPTPLTDPTDPNDPNDYEPPEIRSPAQISDSYDYEPPEPLSPKEPDSTYPAISNSGSEAIEPAKTRIASNLEIAPLTSMHDSVEAQPDQVAVNEDVPISQLTVGPALSSITKSSHFTLYESPLKNFKDYRYHPDYLSQVKDGFRSLTYSHAIDPNLDLCRYETLGGICNDNSCESQHFRSMGLSDDAIIVQMGSGKTRTAEERAAYVEGMMRIIKRLRDQGVTHFDTIMSEITSYRRTFQGNPSKILDL